jgi:hypothetical protein
VTFTIEKEIPMPKRALGGKYPLGTMECGDSFFIPAADRNIQITLPSYWCKHRPKKFVSRQIKEDGVVTGIRVWRIE